eukprot:GHVR01079902.1.p2 GENE.GHVR01079902.1~~GHVR01079902.1.p2  ORF type:complete len:118 (+),score=57.81 GHVR01079902.1:532-885(+)
MYDGSLLYVPDDDALPVPLLYGLRHLAEKPSCVFSGYSGVVFEGGKQSSLHSFMPTDTPTHPPTHPSSHTHKHTQPASFSEDSSPPTDTQTPTYQHTHTHTHTRESIPSPSKNTKTK